ncbi:MAG: DUF1836 domain-containing protein [Eubacteriales bacterium]|nr:DUF1836 domain-containing protein [Eubacteriales bacterium]
MTINPDDMLKSILDSISRIDYIKPDDIPNIDLYMDQVTTFMDSQLKSSKRHPEDKILTKTMINNYAKNHLLPSPDKKKYSKEHVLILIFIYYFKGFLSIPDIQALLEPLTKQYFKNTDGLCIESLYREVFSMEKAQAEHMRTDLEEKYAIALNTFKDAPEEEQEFLHLFSFISLLSFDVYVKKQIIEKIIDSFSSD